ncbi:sugar ABC transporter substrate-binding protein [Chloroflexia bacterium SDU3-3]|nr:sugar ABC transporter substrate-binding protein [Chloroflexia bacterium SDU3-3]
MIWPPVRRTTAVALALSAVLLAGCGTQAGRAAPAPTAPAPTPAPTATPTATPTPSSDTVTLRWYMRWDKVRVDTIAKPVIEEFERTHPTIKIKFENVSVSSEYWTQLQSTLSDGTGPDIFYPQVYQVDKMGKSGYLLDLNPYLARDRIDTAAYDQKAFEMYQFDQKQYGLPVDLVPVVIAYNRDMFDAAGLPYPTDDWTWDDFLAAAQKLTLDKDGDGAVDQYGVDQFTNYWPVYLWSKTGHGVFDDERAPTQFLLGEQDSVDALQWLADLTAKHHVMPTSAERGESSDLFLDGKAAMTMLAHRQLPQYLRNAAFSWDLAAFPHGKARVVRVDGSAFVINAHTAHPDEAWEFVKFLAGPEGHGVRMLVSLQQMLPSLSALQQTDDFLRPKERPTLHKDAFLPTTDTVRISMYQPITALYEPVSQIEGESLGKLWEGKITAAEAVREMEPKIATLLKQP